MARRPTRGLRDSHRSAADRQVAFAVIVENAGLRSALGRADCRRAGERRAGSGVGEMNTTDVAGRMWALGERLHATVRRFFDSPLGPDAKPLEIREAMLEDIERQVTPLGGGRRVFPFARLVARVVAPAASRGTCEATFSDFDARVRARLAELRCEAPPDLDVRVVVLRKTPADWETGRIFALDYRRAPEPASRATTDAPRPVLQVTVLAGAATQPAYTIESPTVLVGRGVEPVDHAGRVRRNHVAFVEEADEVAETVGRAHARFTWDAAAGEYRVFDEGSSNGTHVLRGGTSISGARRAIRAACACGRAMRFSSAARGCGSRCGRSRTTDRADGRGLTRVTYGSRNRTHSSACRH